MLADARAWRFEAQSQPRRGTMRAPTRTTLSEAAAEWLSGARQGVIRTRSGDTRLAPGRRRTVSICSSGIVVGVRRVDVGGALDREAAVHAVAGIAGLNHLVALVARVGWGRTHSCSGVAGRTLVITPSKGQRRRLMRSPRNQFQAGARPVDAVPALQDRTQAAGIA